MNSNYIVACNKSTKININVCIDLEENGITINSVAELTKYFYKKYGDDIYNEGNLEYQTYENCKKAIENGKFIIIGKFHTCCDNNFEGYVTDTDIKPMRENDLHQSKFIWKFEFNKELNPDKLLTDEEFSKRCGSVSGKQRWDADYDDGHEDSPSRYLIGHAPCDRVEYVDSCSGGL